MAAAGQRFTEDEIKQGLLAVIAMNGNVLAATRALEEADPPMFVNNTTLRAWVNKDHMIEYQRLRDEYEAQMEQHLADSFRGVAAQSVEVQSLALGAAKERLGKGVDSEPAKTAMLAARAGGTAVEKLMTLTNRPERITEQRDVSDVLRSLVGKGVLKMIPQAVPDPPESSVDGSVEDAA